MRDQNQMTGYHLLRWLGRVDVLVMLIAIVFWIVVALRSLLVVGESLLLLIPLILICFTILLYLTLESTRIPSFIRAVVIGSTNGWLFWTYPL
ncbi:hypothetical protein ACFZAC_15220 [Pseudomonas fluorescens]|uniref:hypothetical protein n=1 Tax=Pseudomonas fluorescens TaxID=294 RepID=UPI003747F4F3